MFLKELKPLLITWDKKFYNKSKRDINYISNQIKTLQSSGPFLEKNYELELLFLNKMHDLELYEESLRKSKARDHFIKCGDKNTGYFQNNGKGDGKSTK